MRKIVLSFASLVLITSLVGTSIFIISKNKGPASNEPEIESIEVTQEDMLNYTKENMSEEGIDPATSIIIIDGKYYDGYGNPISEEAFNQMIEEGKKKEAEIQAENERIAKLLEAKANSEVKESAPEVKEEQKEAEVSETPEDALETSSDEIKEDPTENEEVITEEVKLDLETEVSVGEPIEAPEEIIVNEEGNEENE